MNHLIPRLVFTLQTFTLLVSLTAIGALMISCESSQDQYSKSGYASRFGVMARGPDGVFRVYAETTEIHRQVDLDYVHGFEVKRKDDNRFMAHFQVRFPEPITVSPELEAAFEVSEGGRVITSPSEIHWGFYSAPFWFSEDDPLGIYQMTIFIDGDSYRTIEYEVVLFGNEVDF